MTDPDDYRDLTVTATMTETTALLPIDVGPNVAVQDIAGQVERRINERGGEATSDEIVALTIEVLWEKQRRATPAALSASPAGWRLVPVEPTPEMVAGALPLAVSSEADRAVAAAIAEKAIALIMPPDAERHSDGLMLAEQMADDYRRMLRAAPPAPAAAPSPDPQEALTALAAARKEG